MPDLPAVDYTWLSCVYDTCVHLEADIPFFLREADHAGGAVLDLMCGTGRLTLPLTRAGRQVTAVDRSLAMLGVLQHKLDTQALKAAVLQRDVCTLDLPQDYAMAVMGGDSFSELLTDQQQERALRCAHDCLKSYGRCIVTHVNATIHLGNLPQGLHFNGKYPAPEGNGDMLRWSLNEYNADSALLEGFQLFEIFEAGLMTERRKVEHRFRLVDPLDFESKALDAGFKVESVFGDFDRSEYREEVSPWLIWVLKK